MKSKTVDKAISDGQLLAVQTLTKIMSSSHSSEQAKINAAKTMLSRGGYPELRASITKTVGNETVNLDRILERRADVVKEIEASKRALREAEERLGGDDGPE